MKINEIKTDHIKNHTTWDYKKVLYNEGINLVSFDSSLYDGIYTGYATLRHNLSIPDAPAVKEIAIQDLYAPSSMNTIVHEIAHHVLDHLALNRREDALSDNTREYEAEWVTATLLKLLEFQEELEESIQYMNYHFEKINYKYPIKKYLKLRKAVDRIFFSGIH